MDHYLPESELARRFFTDVVEPLLSQAVPGRMVIKTKHIGMPVLLQLKHSPSPCRREGLSMPAYAWLAVPPSLAAVLVGVAAVVAVVRADRSDLPAIVRALMRMGHDEGKGNPPPSLPAPLQSSRDLEQSRAELMQAEHQLAESQMRHPS